MRTPPPGRSGGTWQPAASLVIQRTEKDGMAVATGEGMAVALETALTPELEAEGFAREFVSKVQNLRKERNFDVADRIAVVCEAPESAVASLRKHADYICGEILAAKLDFGPAANGAECDVNGVVCKVAVEKA